jgi:hypothetical protein
MKNSLACLIVAGSLVLGSIAASAQQAGTHAIDGVWEGPWYRGMTSGRAKLEIKEGEGTIQLAALDNFGNEPQPVRELGFDGKTLTFRTKGEGGSTLTATLKLNDAVTDLKGMCKFEGFTVRVEVKRVLTQ